jgi:hypothetical protein
MREVDSQRMPEGGAAVWRTVRAIRLIGGALLSVWAATAGTGSSELPDLRGYDRLRQLGRRLEDDDLDAEVCDGARPRRTLLPLHLHGHRYTKGGQLVLQLAAFVGEVLRGVAGGQETGFHLRDIAG